MSVPISGILIWELISDEKDGYDWATLVMELTR
jgi:hypothetical protein